MQLREKKVKNAIEVINVWNSTSCVGPLKALGALRLEEASYIIGSKVMNYLKFTILLGTSKLLGMLDIRPQSQWNYEPQVTNHKDTFETIKNL